MLGGGNYFVVALAMAVNPQETILNKQVFFIEVPVRSIPPSALSPTYLVERHTKC
jgi:hypothetical protein